MKNKLYDLIIRNGLVINASHKKTSDICITDGRINALDDEHEGKAVRIIDASGKLVLPGVIDAHVHMRILQQNIFATADDFETGTNAAIAGGVTTILDFITPGEKETLHDAFLKRRVIADPQVKIDYGLHGVITRGCDLSAEIDDLIEAGITTFKMFQVYDRLALNDAELYAAFETISSRGALAMLHAENGAIQELLTNRLRQQGQVDAIEHANSRPPFVESDCVESAIKYSKVCGNSLYIVHTSTSEALQAITTAQKAGQDVYSETCPQYLVLDKKRLEREDGNLYLCTPPLREEQHQEALWQGLSNGSIQVMATDHCSFYRQQKLKSRSFFEAPMGVGSIELLLPIVYTEGVTKGRMNVQRMVQVLSYNPAAIFGLLPSKGQIAPGADADIVIFDPSKKWEVKSELLNGEDDYSVYEGFQLQGQVEITISNGEVVFQRGEICAEAGRGRFLKRKLVDKTNLIQMQTQMSNAVA